MSELRRQLIRADDSASIDAFSRWRTPEPNYVFDTNFQYDLQPLVFQAITAESGATVAHETTERSALMTFANTPTGGKAYMQTYEHFRYQAGRSLGTLSVVATGIGGTSACRAVLNWRETR